MAKDDKKESPIKDYAIAAVGCGPMLYILIGGMAWIGGRFDGTIMEQIFPATFGGFLVGFFVLIVLSNIFDSRAVWVTGSLIVFVATTVCYYLGLTSVLKVGGIVLGVGLCLLALIKWIVSK